MSQEWLNIQSFFSDHELIGAINDLSLHLKQEAAGIRDTERARRAKNARRVLKDFLDRLSQIEAVCEHEPVFGVDPRFQSLTDAISAARQEPDRYTSVLIQEGAEKTLPLLDAKSADERSQLLESLAELRQVISQHQQTDISVIFEDQ